VWHELGWAAYPVAAVLEAVGGNTRNGFDLAFGGDLPIGAGLASSAAILVAVIHAVRAILGLETSPAAVARAAHRAESGCVGVRCGIMDPFAIALGRAGHALWLDCRDGSHEWVPIAGVPADLVVLDSGTRRALVDGRYNERVAESSAAFEKLRARLPEIGSLSDVTAAQLEGLRGGLDALELRRARHVVSEVERVRRGRAHLKRGELREFGSLLAQSHRSLRDDFEVSTDRLDALVEIASAREDCFGARLTGAGFGGCAFALVRGGAAGSFAATVGAEFERRFGERPAIHVVGTGGGVREWRER
jgi:galactokinase